jgi:hypothetical protein
MRRALWLMVTILIASPVLSARANRVVLVTTDRGQFYLRGTLVPPPYEVSISFHLADGDTIWEQVYVNDLPLEPRRAPQPHVPNPRDSLWDARETAYRSALEKAHIPLGPVSLESTRKIAAVYASLDTMVDSVRVLYQGEFLVYWHGESGSMYPLHVTVDDHPHPTPAQASRDLLLHVRNTYGFTLASGEVVMQSDDVLLIPNSRVPQFARELDILRHGGSGPFIILRSPQHRGELLHPQPLPPPER